MEQIEHHEMFTKFTRYFVGGPKIVRKASKKAKKLIENIKNQKEESDAYPTFSSLEESIAYKRDYTKSSYATFEPSKVEKDWNEWWIQKRFFNISAEEALKAPKEKRFVIPWPPSNVTGYLHLGHAITAAVEDCMTRWHRMKGDKTLFVPGVDHAGIATQAVVEKKLFAEQGIKKADLGREKFVAEVYKWKDHSCARIVEQLKSMSCSTDWDRFIFTMDEPRNKAVNEAFARLYEMGVIYRANRLVNWSCSLRTAISDIEVNYEEINKPTKFQVPGHPSWYEFGTLTEFAYKTKDGTDEIVVATTRIETMLGDTAVAVHPDDKRYQHLIGKELVHPFISTRSLKVIADAELVDMNFGTGAVKITPAHDPNDFVCGNKHGLEFVTIFNDDGTLNDNGGKYKGMLRYEVRLQIWKDLEEMKLLRGKKPHAMRLGFCDRSGDVIEPMVKPQWYVKMTDDLIKHMLDVVKTGDLKITPAIYQNVWNGWVNKLEDWCVSRQLWWGHRIPAYLVKVKGAATNPNPNDGKDWIIGRDIEEATKRAEEKYGVSRDKLELTQDEDVLDTWFSSALYPFSIFGWPDKTKDLEAFYPNTILETGHDILFFWVARMVIMSYYLTDKQLPYKNVFLHSIVRDEKGEKMSKSKGNVIDPMEIIKGCSVEVLLDKIKNSALSEKEKASSIAYKKKAFAMGIPECGTDSLRFGLLSYVHHGKDINLDLNVLISVRQFCNKIWNSYKFAMMNVGNDFKYDPSNIKIDQLNLADKWILTKLNEAARSINENFTGYFYSEATCDFTNFWVDKFCDIYLEYSKIALKDEKRALITKTILFHILETGLRLLHPMMTYISEELFQKLPSWPGKPESVCIAPYPEPNANHIFEGVEQFDSLFEVITDIRKILGTINLPPKSNPPVFVAVTNQDAAGVDLITTFGDFISNLSKTGEVKVLTAGESAPKGCISVLSAKNFTLHVEVIKFIKVDEEIKKIQKTISEKDKAVETLKKKMEAKDYTSKVPEDVRVKDQEKLDLYEAELTTLRGNIATFEKMTK
jgi:valyl-tRNA synthetase